MITFTASEVVAKLRERFASGNDVPVPDVRLTRAEFDVIADRLEADDKAEPVAWVNPDDLHNPNFVGVNAVKVGHESLGKHYTLPLYTHPVPADAERLAEALRAKIRRLRNMPNGEFQLAASIFADDLERILAAHSAQTQPVAKCDGQSCVHCEPEHGCPPPATSVPDGFVLVQREPTEAMVDAVCKIKLARLEALRTGHGATSGIVTAVREEWDAMLAAQENPNG